MDFWTFADRNAGGLGLLIFGLVFCYGVYKLIVMAAGTGDDS